MANYCNCAFGAYKLNFSKYFPNLYIFPELNIKLCCMVGLFLYVFVLQNLSRKGKQKFFSVILYIEGNIPVHKKRSALYGKKRR